MTRKRRTADESRQFARCWELRTLALCLVLSSSLRTFGVDGPPVHFIGLAFPTRMIIVRLVDDCLWVNSPVVVRSEVLEGIKALGSVKHLVAPTRRHV